MPDPRIITGSVFNTDGTPAFTVEIEVESPPEDCSCDNSGLYSLGSVESIRGGYTDPECVHHGQR